MLLVERTGRRYLVIFLLTQKTRLDTFDGALMSKVHFPVDIEQGRDPHSWIPQAITARATACHMAKRAVAPFRFALSGYLGVRVGCSRIMVLFQPVSTTT